MMGEIILDRGNRFGGIWIFLLAAMTHGYEPKVPVCSRDSQLWTENACLWQECGWKSWNIWDFHQIFDDFQTNSCHKQEFSVSSHVSWLWINIQMNNMEGLLIFCIWCIITHPESLIYLVWNILQYVR